MKKYYLETYGCQMNFAESAALENALKERGWRPTENPQEAQAIVLNTCSVRKSAEERIWGRLGFFKSALYGKPVSLVLCGCLADHYGEEIRRRFPFVDCVAGNGEKNRLPEILDQLTENRGEIDLERSSVFAFGGNHFIPGSFKAFVPIMHGCNNFCTYCIVPYVRGREISRNPEEIINEINGLTEKGVQEITLLGQNVNSYAANGRSFGQLLAEICSLTPVKWLRFVSSHPKDLSDEIIAAMAEFPQICKSLHLPVQHGSDRILSGMNRRYTRDYYLNLVSRIRARMPQIALSTDLLVGFPGETGEDLDETLDLIRRVGFEDAFTYFFNPRTGTAAAEMKGQLSEEVKKERLGRVIELQRQISVREKTKRLGQTVTVLAEEVSKKNESEILGRTEQNNMVVFPGKNGIIGTFVRVRLLSLSGTTYRGQLDDTV